MKGGDFVSSKAKTITQQIEELEKENARLNELDRLFDKAIKLEFDLDRKTIHRLIDHVLKNEASHDRG